MFFQHPIKAYWWTGVSNFGDELSPLLLNHFANIKIKWAAVSHARLVSTGSLLEHIPPLWDGFVLGSGRLFENSRLHVSPKHAQIISVRGPLSARGLGSGIAIGDPGLLANELVGPQGKPYDLGIVPHWKDTALALKFMRLIKPPAVVKIINPMDDPLEVVRQIGQCRRIVTSSLHGMIVADSFFIPRRFEFCDKLANEGNDFKFRDYSAAIKTPLKVGVMQTPSRFQIESIKHSVYDSFKELKSRLK